MPYEKISELPDQVKNVLPHHGQEIYRAAYNNAWDKYKKPADRKDDSSREETAHKVAWTAIKKKYKKNQEGDWVEK
jgi:cation transport regulator